VPNSITLANPLSRCFRSSLEMKPSFAGLKPKPAVVYDLLSFLDYVFSARTGVYSLPFAIDFLMVGRAYSGDAKRRP
jgi:hypothetical protein